MDRSRSRKHAIYAAARGMGLFALARWLTRKQVRILAYHGFSAHDEHLFRPKLFVAPDTFERRLQRLRHGGYKVVSLGDALRALASRRVEPDTVVITIDDGFARTLEVAAPALQRHGFPALVYLTSYHMHTQTPVFDVLVGYLCWKAPDADYDVDFPALPNGLQISLRSAAARQAALDALLDLGHSLPDEAARVDLCLRLATALGLSTVLGTMSQALRLLAPNEARQLASFGVEIGLHTHRHTFPPGDGARCRREIEDNQRYLKGAVGVEPVHFCYPSGVLGEGQAAVLAEFHLHSATTCEPGLTAYGADPYLLPRFLDGEGVSELEFEAELSGFAPLLRSLATRWRTKQAIQA